MNKQKYRKKDEIQEGYMHIHSLLYGHKHIQYTNTYTLVTSSPIYSCLYACVCVFRMSIRVERNGLEKKRKTSFWINTDHMIVIGPFHAINMYVNVNVRVASVIALQPFYNHQHGTG